MNSTRQQNNDQKHLKLLSTLHYVLGGFLAFTSLLPLIHLALGISIITQSIPADSAENLFPQEFGYFFAAAGAIFFLIGEAFAVAIIVSGRSLKRCRRYWFSFGIACFLCLITPLGTGLGVFTLIVLSRQSVKELYSLPSPTL